MKYYLTLMSLLLLTATSFAQEQKIDVSLNYPVLVGDNFVGALYTSVIDLGGGYRFEESDLLTFGVSFNGSMLFNSANPDVTVNTYLLQPRLFAELKLEDAESVHPSVGVGYAVMIFDVAGASNGFDVSGSGSQGGIDLNLRVGVDLTKRLFAQLQYDFIKLNSPEGIPATTFNTNINIVKPGIGYRF